MNGTAALQSNIVTGARSPLVESQRQPRHVSPGNRQRRKDRRSTWTTLVWCFCVLLCHTTWLTCTFLSFLFTTTSTPGNCLIHLPSELCCDSCHKPRFHFRFVRMVKCVKRRDFWWVKIPGRLLVFLPLHIFSPAICRHCSVPHRAKRDRASWCKACLYPLLQYCEIRHWNMAVGICKLIHKAQCFWTKENSECVKAPWDVGAWTPEALPVISWTDVQRLEDDQAINHCCFGKKTLPSLWTALN